MLNPRQAYSKEGLDLTTRFEGFREKAYQDTGGVWTCGFGHTRGVGPSTTCTKDIALRWLQEDVQEAVNAVNNLVDVELYQTEFDALVDFVFNVGVSNFSRSTLLILLNGSKYDEAAEQFERWNQDNGKVIAGLIKRRQAEEDLFNSAPKEYPPGYE